MCVGLRTKGSACILLDYLNIYYIYPRNCAYWNMHTFFKNLKRNGIVGITDLTPVTIRLCRLNSLNKHVFFSSEQKNKNRSHGRASMNKKDPLCV